MAASMGRMSWNNTGSWRNVEPVHRDLAAPCSAKCPAGNDVVGMLRLTAEGKFAEAWELFRQTSPFPGVCGRVCPHPCESECNRETLGGKINIHSIERFLADMNADASMPGGNIQYPEREIAVIGSGPAGLSAAYHLARQGYPVVVFESHSQAGGMMRVGIPDYRLPKNVLDREIAAIMALGVDIRTGISVGRDIGFSRLKNDFSAVFIATGYHRSRSLGIEGEESAGRRNVLSGIEVLKRISQRLDPGLKERIIVVGGGNTAMDAARSAARLGSEVKVIYRRTRTEMPAIAEEIDELLAEGIPVEFLTTPVKIHIDNGGISQVEYIRMKLGEPDESGRRRPQPIPGSNFTMETDQVITAIGETPNLSFIEGELKFERWGIPANDFGITNVGGVFAGGDVATGAGTVSHAIGSGRRVAAAIIRYLNGEPLEERDKFSPCLKRVGSKMVRLDDLNLDYFRKIPAVEPPHIDLNERLGNFREIYRVLEEEQALREAQRCMSCGSCTSCDNCFVFCPDAAIHYGILPDEHYRIDLDHCKGCGLCASECPRNCIELKPLR